MARTSARNRIIDLLLDPMAAAILASIGLHASIGASLPYWLQPLKPGVTNPGTDTVKVVELTPNELQRIPQVAAQPTPAPAATPTPQAAAQPQPIATPTPAAPSQPSAPKFGTAPLRIPFAPVPSTGGATVPLPAAKPPTGDSRSEGLRQRNPPVTGKPASKSGTRQTATTIVDPKDFFPEPQTTTPAKAPKGNKITPTTEPSPTITTTPTQPKTSTPKSKSKKTANTGNDGKPDENGNESSTPKTNTTPTNAPEQKPAGNGSPTGKPGAKPSTQSPEPGSGNPNAIKIRNGSNTFARMQERLNEFRKKYPGMRIYRSSSDEKLTLSKNTPCLRSAVKVVVLLDKLPTQQEASVLGKSTADLAPDEPFNPAAYSDDPAILKLLQNNTDRFTERVLEQGQKQAKKLDLNRSDNERDSKVYYEINVPFDLSTCK